jgi:hypothetical protein
MTTNLIPMFYGDGRANENPNDFLKSVQATFENQPGIKEEEKCERLYLRCKSDFDAEEWYDTLAAADKASWTALVAAFRLRWPRRAKTQKTPEQKKAELFAEVLHEEKMLEKEEIGGSEVYKYIAWADRVDQLATALGDTQGFLVSVMRDALPKALRNVIGTSHTDWTTFTTAVRNVSHTALQSAIDDENRLRNLENAAARQTLLQSPTAAIRQSLTRAHISTVRPPSPTPQRTPARFIPTATTPQPDVFAGGGTARTRLFAYQTNQTPAIQSAAPPQRAAVPQSAYRDPRVRLLDLLRNLLPHHPDTETGRTAYHAQVDEWHRKHGFYPQASPNELKPYPLTPGTQPLNTGACFNCGGRHGDTKHMQFDCPVKRQPGSVPAPERAFRSVAAVCYGLIRGPPAPTPIRSINVANAIDVTNADENYVRSLIDAGAFITEASEEEKEHGLSN